MRAAPFHRVVLPGGPARDPALARGSPRPRPRSIGPAIVLLLMLAPWPAARAAEPTAREAE